MAAEAGPSESVPPTVAFADGEALQARASSPEPDPDPAEHVQPSCQAPVRDQGAGQPAGHGRSVPDALGAGKRWPGADAARPSEPGEADAAPAAPPVPPTVPQGDAAAQTDSLEQHVGSADGVPPTLPLGEAEPESPDPGLPPTLRLAASPQRGTGLMAAKPCADWCLLC